MTSQELLIYMLRPKNTVIVDGEVRKKWWNWRNTARARMVSDKDAREQERLAQIEEDHKRDVLAGMKLWDEIS